MTFSQTLTRGLLAGAFLACAAGAEAQTAAAPANDTAKQGAMASDMAKLSKDDQATLKRCKQMPHDAMTADAKCKAFIDAHPTLAPRDKATSTGKPKPPA